MKLPTLVLLSLKVAMQGVRKQMRFRESADRYKQGRWTADVLGVKDTRDRVQKVTGVTESNGIHFGKAPQQGIRGQSSKCDKCYITRCYLLNHPSKETKTMCWCDLFNSSRCDHLWKLSPQQRGTVCGNWPIDGISSMTPLWGTSAP